LDEELELEYDREIEEVPQIEVLNHEEYPPGFFSSL
jgi:hypothetical protein